jgi:hypothetical protein
MTSTTFTKEKKNIYIKKNQKKKKIQIVDVTKHEKTRKDTKEKKMI